MSTEREGTTRDESYLGDGLYATFDGWQMILRTARDNGEHYVAMEPEVFTALVRFAERINGKYGVLHFDALRGPLTSTERATDNK